MGMLIRGFDWAATSLGPIPSWPQSLKSVVDTVLNSPLAMVLLMGHERIMLYNDEYIAILGDKHPRGLGMRCQDIWPEIWDDWNYPITERVFNGELVTYREQCLSLNRNGRWDDVWLDLYYTPVRNESGETIGTLCIAADLTRRIMNERRMETLRALGLRSTLPTFDEAAASAIDVLAEDADDIPFALIYLLDADNTVRLAAVYGGEVRPEAREFGLDEQTPWAMLLSRVHHRGIAEATTAEPVMASISSRSASGRMYVLPLLAAGRIVGFLLAGKNRGITPDGDYERFFTLVASQVSSALGTTRLLQHERSRARTLEQQVATAVAERAAVEEQFRQAQKMESIGKLTGGVAHDFNNLLQVVGGNLQLLVKDVAGNARAEQRVQNALAGVTRGAKLASQLLAFGRRQPLEPKVVNIGRFITGMGDMLRRAIGEEIEIETVVSGGLWNCLVDPSQIENALLNLAINARDAMNGSGKVTIEAGNALLDDAYARAHADVKAGQYVMIAVSDSGSGIDPKIMNQVFEPFFTTKPEGKGTGLGLSMVYGFVKQSGGHVKIYSELGQGTTIKLYFPRANRAEDVVTETDNGPISGGSETILVAEDDEAVRETVVAMLSELGYRVLKAKDAQSALAIVESGVPIDLLFTDVVMPGPVRSTDLARRASARLPGLGVLFTSGYTENSIVHDGRLDEGVQLLSKPYTREALARKIRQVLAGRPRPSDTPPSVDGASQSVVLLVEDNELVRATTAEMIEGLGLNLVQAGSGREALAVLAKTGSRIDVMITDIGLPDMNGSALAKEALLRDPDIGIVFATGQDGVPDWKDNDRSALLRKPYNSQSLALAIERVRMKD
jgi:PAS domain S-box-containing protein